MQLSSQFAIDIKYQVEFIEPPPFTLYSGDAISDFTQLTVFAEGVTHKFWEETEDTTAKYGEMSVSFYSSKGSPISIDLWVYAPVFNTLMQLHQTGSLPKDIHLGFDEDTFIRKEVDYKPDEYQLMDTMAGISKTNPSLCWYLFNT